MDERVVISCPHCSEQFRIRRDVLGRDARCSKCRQIFSLALPQGLDEDEILNLVACAKRDDEEDTDTEVKNATVAGLRVMETPPEPAFPTVVQPDPSDSGAGLALHTLDAKGAHFRVSVDRLKSEKFRASFPKVCAHCFEKRNLHVFLLRWSPNPWGPAGYGSRNTLRPVSSLAELPQGDPIELLKYLPAEKKLPHPFDLPFPYYVCTKCKPEGLVYPAGVIEPSESSCMMTISNIDLAFEFYTANAGTDTDDYRQLLTRTRLCKIPPWDSLDEQVRKRISVWFKPAQTESFVCYIHDLDTPHDLRGQTGIVVTTQRLVCGKEPLSRQYALTEHITVTRQSIPKGMKVEIASADQGKITFQLRDASWLNLHHALDSLKTGIRFLKI